MNADCSCLIFHNYRVCLGNEWNRFEFRGSLRSSSGANLTASWTELFPTKTGRFLGLLEASLRSLKAAVVGKEAFNFEMLMGLSFRLLVRERQGGRCGQY